MLRSLGLWIISREDYSWSEYFPLPCSGKLRFDPICKAHSCPRSDMLSEVHSLGPNAATFLPKLPRGLILPPKETLFQGDLKHYTDKTSSNELMFSKVNSDGAIKTIQI